MKQNEKATLESQLGNEVCMVEDTEEMFWLCESDDYQSAVKLGDALVSQYRFKEAINSYKNAMSIKNDDGMLYMKLGGSYLTLFQFDNAEISYHTARDHGIKESALAYPLGVWHYLKGDYDLAADSFLKCLPCNDELKIAVIYWHTLASYRADLPATLFNQYHSELSVGHHTAYKEAVSVFCDGNADFTVPNIKESLDGVIINYGLSVFCEHLGLRKKAQKYLESALVYKSVWPSIAYLAAWNDDRMHKM